MRNLVTRILELRREDLAAVMSRRPSWTRSMVESIKEYRPVPEGAARRGEAAWRLAIGDLGPDSAVMGLEVWADVVLGRSVEANGIDVDFSPYDAEELGVSRRHAMIRPTPSGLFLIDLGSTNGTLCNLVLLGAGKAHRLTEGDVIFLGGLYFSVMAVLPPE
jgi:hypothetical protein